MKIVCRPDEEVIIELDERDMDELELKGIGDFDRCRIKDTAGNFIAEGRVRTYGSGWIIDDIKSTTELDQEQLDKVRRDHDDLFGDAKIRGIITWPTDKPIE